MLTNATLTQIELPSPADSAGDVTYTALPPVAIRCTLTRPTATLEQHPDAQTLSATATLTILQRPLTAAYPLGADPAPNQRLTLRPDDGPQITYRITSLTTHHKHPLTHHLVTLA